MAIQYICYASNSLLIRNRSACPTPALKVKMIETFVLETSCAGPSCLTECRVSIDFPWVSNMFNDGIIYPYRISISY